MQKTMETLAHAIVGLFLFTLFFLHLSPGQLMAQGSQGWGINQAVAKMKSFVNTLPPGKNRSNAEKDDWMNMYEGIILIHEGVHVDQADSNDVNRKKNECEAWKLTYDLMVEVSWQDPCLDVEWTKRRIAAARAVLRFCTF